MPIVSNPFKTFGNIQLKDAFDEAGNAIQEVIKRGMPSVVPRFDCRAEPKRPDYDIVIPEKFKKLKDGIII